MIIKMAFASMLATAVCVHACAQTDTVTQINNSIKHPAADSIVYKPLTKLTGAGFERPQRFGYITNVPDDLWKMAKSPFNKESLPGLFAVAGSTAILIWQDQHLIDGAQRLGRTIHLDPRSTFKIAFKIKDTKIIKVPQNLNTVFYQLGEGGTSMIVAGGLYLFGKIKHDNRSLQTASDLTETFFSMGIATQLVKRAFGRQSPFISSQQGGAWHPFPAFSDYEQNTSNYDGFPSGHLATMMATVTVLAEDYPEKRWIKPVGYTLMTLTSFAMMNAKVHWAGDYPLALALGYVAGEITVNRHKKKRRNVEF